MKNSQPEKGTVKIEWLPIDELTYHKKNPRKVKAKELERLANSIKEDPSYMERRPILVNRITADGAEPVYQIYAGEQRHKSCKKLGWTEVPCIVDDNVPEELIHERMTRDNLHAGEWDIELFKENFDQDFAKKMGLDGLIKYQDDYEKELAKHDDTNCTYPIVPKFTEKYNCVIVMIENDLDYNWIKNVFKLQEMQDFKNSRTGISHVVTAKHLQNVFENYEL